LIRRKPSNFIALGIFHIGQFHAVVPGQLGKQRFGFFDQPIIGILDLLVDAGLRLGEKPAFLAFGVIVGKLYVRLNVFDYMIGSFRIKY